MFLMLVAARPRRSTRKINTAGFRRQLRKLRVTRAQNYVDADTYRGVLVEEYSRMSLSEILTHMNSNVRRHYRRGLTGANAQLFNRLLTTEASVEPRTHCRDFIILPIHVGRRIHVHNGRAFIPVQVNILMVGYRLGEFALTRLRPQHKSPGIGASRSSKARATAKT